MQTCPITPDVLLSCVAANAASVAVDGTEFCAPHRELAADGELPTTETAGVTSLAPIVADGGTITEQ